MEITWEDALKNREDRGITLGEARGRLAATRKAVALLARKVLADVSVDLEARLEAIDDLDRLYALLEQIPGARSAAELDLA